MCGNCEETISFNFFSWQFCNSWRLLGDFCFLQGEFRGCNSRLLAGRSSRMQLTLIGRDKKQGPQGNCWSQPWGAGGGEREFLAKSNGCAKRIVALE